MRSSKVGVKAPSHPPKNNSHTIPASIVIVRYPCWCFQTYFLIPIFNVTTLLTKIILNGLWSQGRAANKIGRDESSTETAGRKSNPIYWKSFRDGIIWMGAIHTLLTYAFVFVLKVRKFKMTSTNGTYFRIVCCLYWSTSEKFLLRFTLSARHTKQYVVGCRCQSLVVSVIISLHIIRFARRGRSRNTLQS